MTTKHDEEKSRAARHPADRGDDDERRVIREEDRRQHDFIERTRPEDRLDQSERPGQLTRDNVNPNIPSAPRGERGKPDEHGGIVDPHTLGMDQGQQGEQPPEGPQVEQWPSLGLDHTKDGMDDVQAAENRQRQAEQGSGGLGLPREGSINEPPGSNVLPGEGGPNQIPDDPKHELPPLVLTDIDPDSAQIGMTDFTLTVTGSGFTPNTVVVFDDEELPTVFVNQTTLTTNPPLPAEAATVDVEVHRGEEMSDVLTFEIVAPAGRRSSEKAERKPKKNEPRHKRNKTRRAR